MDAKDEHGWSAKDKYELLHCVELSTIFHEDSGGFNHYETRSEHK